MDKKKEYVFQKDNPKDASDYLQEHGFVVISIASAFQLVYLNVLFKDYINNIPEMKPGRYKFGEMIDISSGSFGAINLASAYHCLVKRVGNSLQAVAAFLILKFIAVALGLKYIQCVPDRLFYRTKRQNPESYHTDNTNGAGDPTDIFMGCLLNCNTETNQIFTLVPKSHSKSARMAGGEFTALDLTPSLKKRLQLPPDFAQGLDKKETRKLLKTYLKKNELVVQVPPGHMILFFENIVHRVSGSKPQVPLLKTGIGFRLTNCDTPWYGKEIEDSLISQAPMRHKGGEIAPPYPKLWWTNWLPKLISYTENFKDECITTRERKTTSQTISVPFFPSLDEIDMKYPDYSEAELSLYRLKEI